MLPGMTANVRIITDSRDDVLKVPNAALRVRIAGVEPEAPAGAAPPASAPRAADAGGWGWPSAHAQGAAPGALRQRLVEGLQLDAEQQVKLDAVLAEMRPDFMALRDFPEEQRAPAREQLLIVLRKRIDAFLTPAQREAYGKLQAQAAEARASAAAASAPAVAAAARETPAAAAAAPATPAPARAPAAAAQVAAPDTPASGPLGEFRKRLVTELGLTPQQSAQVDAVITAQRPRFGELRNLPEIQRGKARDRILADMRALISDQLTPEQKPKYQALLAEMAGRQTTRGRIFVLGADGKPRAHDVRLGISDGVMTELIVTPGSPAAGVLVEGAEVITAVITAPSPGDGCATDRRAEAVLSSRPRWH